MKPKTTTFTKENKKVTVPESYNSFVKEVVCYISEKYDFRSVASTLVPVAVNRTVLAVVIYFGPVTMWLAPDVLIPICIKHREDWQKEVDRILMFRLQYMVNELLQPDEGVYTS